MRQGQGQLIPATRRPYRKLRMLAQVTESSLKLARFASDPSLAHAAALLAAECALHAERIARFADRRPPLDHFLAHLSGVWGPGAVCPESPTAILDVLTDPTLAATSPLSNTGLLAQIDPGTFTDPCTASKQINGLGGQGGGVATGSISGVSA